jgi:co-chaperonin GroES (HSP10)
MVQPFLFPAWANLATFNAMKLNPDNKLKKIIVVGDRVLIRPVKESERTESGLYLPPGVQEKEKIQRGYVIKVGPGYPLPMPADEDDMWKGKEEQVKYLPLQAQEGDLAIFLQKAAIEVMYENEKYFIVPQSSILMLEREEEL